MRKLMAVVVGVLLAACSGGVGGEDAATSTTKAPQEIETVEPSTTTTEATTTTTAAPSLKSWWLDNEAMIGRLRDDVTDLKTAVQANDFDTIALKCIEIGRWGEASSAMDAPPTDEASRKWTELGDAAVQLERGCPPTMPASDDPVMVDSLMQVGEALIAFYEIPLD